MKRALLSMAGFGAILALVPAQEVQRHGLVFESWVRATFFARYQPASYTQHRATNRDHGGIPVNPKAVIEMNLKIDARGR